jgi:purine-binding chemotaxis protein CheW
MADSRAATWPGWFFEERKSVIMEFNDESTDGNLITGFTVSDASFGVDARLVLEVVKVGDLTQVHGAPRDVVGLRNLRGRIVTVVDMATHLGLGSVEIGPDSRLLIMESHGESFGFLVEAVTDALSIELSGLGTPPASLDPVLRGRLLGVWREGERLTAVLDPAVLFRWEESAA